MYHKTIIVPKMSGNTIKNLLEPLGHMPMVVCIRASDPAFIPLSCVFNSRNAPGFVKAAPLLPRVMWTETRDGTEVEAVLLHAARCHFIVCRPQGEVDLCITEASFNPN